MKHVVLQYMVNPKKKMETSNQTKRNLVVAFTEAQRQFVACFLLF
jgi:hypothetical protein